MQSKAQVVLVTGASSGIGRAIAETLARQGMRVFGTSRRPENVTPIEGVEFLPLDVNADESVQRCVQTIIDRAGRIDILVNNAGVQMGGAIEETSVDEARAHFDTNFFGVSRVVGAVLPAMRERGSGRIINMSSVVGWLVPVPFFGYYAASKMALEAYSEVLRFEVKPFGVKVSSVEPGFIKTNLVTNRQMAARNVDAYDPWQARALGVMEEKEAAAPSPEKVARTVLRAIRDNNPAPRYVVGDGVWALQFIRRWLPWFAYEQGTRGFFRLDKAANG